MSQVASLRRTDKTAEDAVWLRGTVKWFDPVRRWGFVFLDDHPGEEVFLYWLQMMTSGISAERANKLMPGERVRVVVGPDPRPNYPNRRVERIKLV